MIEVFKWTDDKNRTNPTGEEHLWQRNQWYSKELESQDELELCTYKAFHAFPTLTHALLLHGDVCLSEYTRLWKGQADGYMTADDDKVGSSEMRLLTTIPKSRYAPLKRKVKSKTFLWGAIASMFGLEDVDPMTADGRIDLLQHIRYDLGDEYLTNFVASYSHEYDTWRCMKRMILDQYQVENNISFILRSYKRMRKYERVVLGI